MDRYRELFEHSADAILIIEDGKFVDCNFATLKMLGYKTKEEFLNTHPSELSPEKQPDGQLSYDKADEMMRIALEKGSNRFEWDHVRANGEVFPVEVLLTPVNSDNGRFLHVVWRDITERVRRDKELEANYNLLNSIIENQPTCVKILNNEGILLDMNPAGLAMIKAKSKAEVVGAQIYDLIAEEDRERFRRFNEDVCSGQKKGLKFKIVDLEGETHFMDSVAVPFFFDRTGEIVQLGITRDVTEQLKSEKERDSLSKRLKQAQKMEAIGTLAGGIAHDFNNILTAILGYAELASASVEEDSEVINDLGEIKKAGERAKDLVQQILAFSRQMESEKQPVQIHLIAKEVLKLLKVTIPATIEIKSQINPKSGIVMADPTQIHQVIMNLCTNAYHAMRETGGTLVLNVDRMEIEPEDSKVSMLHLIPGSYVKIEVSDTGYGMDEMTKERIFEPYFTTKKMGEGTGMGLAVVHGIITDHRGELSVYSEIGKGTSFQLYLPAKSNSLGESVAKRMQQEVPGGNEHILLVDDDSTLVKLGTRLFKKLGYKVTSFISPEEALEEFYASPESYDLVVTDMTMPKMTGAELAQNLLAIRPGLPVILCTGFSEIMNKDMAIKMGIKAYAMKPILRSEIAKLIREVLDEE